LKSRFFVWRGGKGFGDAMGAGTASDSSIESSAQALSIEIGCRKPDTCPGHFDAACDFELIAPEGDGADGRAADTSWCWIAY
jgi:hypothetical protein